MFDLRRWSIWAAIPNRPLELIAFVTKQDPGYAIGWESAARIAIGAKAWLPAQNAIATLDKIEGQHLTAVFLEGQVLEANGKEAEAIGKYKEVISADPMAPLTEYAAQALLGVCYQQKRLDEAVAYFIGLKTESPFIATIIAKGLCSRWSRERSRCGLR